MSQGVLPSTYELEGSPPGMTGLGGLPVYMDMIHQAGLVESITRSIGIREDSQGWTDSQVVISLVMLNLAGGKHVDDLEILQADEGFCRLLQRVEHHGVRRKERREKRRRSVLKVMASKKVRSTGPSNFSDT